MTAKDSSSLAGPRKSGEPTLAARKRLRSAATLTCPSSVRIAQAQAVGPCTSTPFGSAIPPRRTLSSAMPEGYPAASGRRCPTQRRLELLGRGATRDGPAVELHRGHDLANGRGREQLVRVVQVPARERSFLDRPRGE